MNDSTVHTHIAAVQFGQTWEKCNGMSMLPVRFLRLAQSQWGPHLRDMFKIYYVSFEKDPPVAYHFGQSIYKSYFQLTIEGFMLAIFHVGFFVENHQWAL